MTAGSSPDCIRPENGHPWHRANQRGEDDDAIQSVREGAVLLFFFSALAALAQSQASTGAIAGRVLDGTGAALVGAAVIIANPSRAFERKVTTGADGLFAAPLVPPGTYTVSASSAGFQTLKRTEVRVTVGSNIPVNFTPQPSGVTEELTVVAETPLVDSSASVHTATLNETDIANLPINGRRFQDFVTLTPTVQVDPSRGQLSLAGQRGINSNISVYGQPFFGGIRGGERSNFASTSRPTTCSATTT